MHRPGQGDFHNGLSPKCQPFFAEAKDQDADRFAVRPTGSPPPHFRRPVRQSTMIRLATRPIRKIAFGAGRSKKQRAAAAKTGSFGNELSNQFRAAPITGHADSVPAIADTGTIIERHSHRVRYCRIAHHFNSLASAISDGSFGTTAESHGAFDLHGAQRAGLRPEVPRHGGDQVDGPPETVFSSSGAHRRHARSSP